jgi:hypothetical protein
VADAVRGLNAGEAMIGGEALLVKRGGAQAALVAFDRLSPNGVDLRQRPLEKRRATLMPTSSTCR